MLESNESVHILVVDDTLINLQLLKTILSEEKYQIHVAQNGIQALKKVAAVRPDLILLDVMMPGMDGFETCTHLKSSQETEDIPVIFLTARTATKDIVKGFEFGAVDYVTKPFQAAELLARVRIHLELRRKEKKLLQLSRAVEQSPVSVMITDLEGTIEYANPKFSLITGYSFAEVRGQNSWIVKKPDATPVEEYRELWEKITSGQEWQGEFQNKKKNGELYWEAASITPIKDSKGKFTHFLAIEEDITLKKHLEELVKKRTDELHRVNVELDARNRELSILSTTDQLTGLFNRHYLEEKARELIHRCERFGENLALLMLDVDHFKAVNDNFGHDVGDDVLVNIAHVLREYTRKVDVAGRWGGEEFMILFQTDAPGAVVMAEKLRHAVMEKHHEKAGKITASFGVTQYVSGDSMDSLSKRADQALYLAKEHGRNRVEKVFAEAID